MPVFSRLLPTFFTAYGLQTVFASIFVPQQNDKFYDAGGAIGFLTSTFISLYYPSVRRIIWDGAKEPLPSLATFAPRQLLLSAGLAVWSARLGTYLLMRSLKNGGDSRFNEIKKNPKRFSYYWFAQATWTFIVGLPVYLANVISPAAHPPLGYLDYAALALVIGSFTIEVAADYQKASWRHKKDTKQHDQKFITSGLWKLSRHPNYVGEVGIWTGIWALAATALRTSNYPVGTVALAGLSPLLTYHLLRNVSGVPPLERVGNQRFGGDEEWIKYTRSVPVFWPWMKPS